MSMRRRVAAAAIAICSVLAYFALPTTTAEAAIGPEVPVSEPVMETSTKAFNQQNFDAVFTGSGWYVVWAETRGGNLDIFGGRVGLDGSIPDDTGTVISTNINDTTLRAQNPAIAVDANGQFMVVWANGDPHVPPLSSDIYAARISAAGKLLDPVPIPISVGVEDDGNPAIAWNGQTFLVTFTREGPPNATRAAFINPAGTVTPLGEVDPNMTGARVASLGSNFLVAGARGIATIVARRMDGTGAFLGATFRVAKDVPGAKTQTAVAAGTSQWVVTWADKRTNDQADIFAARIKADGTLLDPDNIPVSTAADAQDAPRIAMIGDAALIAWQDRRNGLPAELRGAHFSAAGAVAESDGFKISDAASPGAVELGPNGKYSVVYQRSATEAPFGGATRGFIRTVSPK